MFLIRVKLSYLHRQQSVRLPDVEFVSCLLPNVSGVPREKAEYGDPVPWLVVVTIRRVRNFVHARLPGKAQNKCTRKQK